MQTWLTLTGIGMDFIGFCILLREWWIAMYSEKYELAAEQRLEEQRRLSEFGMKNTEGHLREHMERSAKWREQNAINEARRVRRQALKARRSLFLLATFLIIIGCGLQFAGAVPDSWLDTVAAFIPDMSGA